MKKIEICPECKSDNVDTKIVDEQNDIFKLTCVNCGHTWYEHIENP